MSTVGLSVILTQIRQGIGDDGKDNLTVDGQLTGQQDGANLRFRAGNKYPVDPSGFEVRKNAILLATPAAYALDAAKGVVTFVAPAPVSADILRFTGTWSLFDDDTYYEWLAEAGGFVGVAIDPTAATATTRAQAVLTATEDRFLPAVRSFVGHLFWKRRASEWAQRFGGSAGGTGAAGIDDISNKYLELARHSLDRATKLRDDARTGFGGRMEVAGTVTNFVGLDRGSPRR